MASVTRETKETTIECSLDRGTGEADVTIASAPPTGVDPSIPAGFLTHMVETLARYSDLDITLTAEGDNEHHLAEDVAIVLGRTLREAVDVHRVERVAHAFVPFDEALCFAAVDIVDRPYYRGDLSDVHTLWHHWFRTLAHEARLTLHLETRRGVDAHHIVEGHVKALGLALRRALRPRDEVLSTKGEARYDDGEDA